MNGRSTQTGPVVLIADDDEFFRAALTALFRTRLGFSKAVEASSFDEAVEKIEQENGSVYLAVFDLKMPGLSNPANLRSIREVAPDVTLLVASSSERRADIFSCLEAGVHGYIPKRLGIDELERAVRHVLSGGMYVPRLLADVQGGSPASDRTAGELRGSGRRTGRLPDLTPRQRDVLELIVEGKSNKQIARDLGLGEGTVRVHMTALFRTLGVENRTAAAAAGSSMLSRPEFARH